MSETYTNGSSVEMARIERRVEISRSCVDQQSVSSRVCAWTVYVCVCCTLGEQFGWHNPDRFFCFCEPSSVYERANINLVRCTSNDTSTWQETLLNMLKAHTDSEILFLVLLFWHSPKDLQWPDERHDRRHTQEKRRRSRRSHRDKRAFFGAP